MLISSRLVAALTALTIAASPAIARAGISVSASAPMRADIDMSCHAAAAIAKSPGSASGTFKVVLLVRSGKSRQAYGPWKVTSNTANMKVLNNRSFMVADFVQAVVSGTSLVYASETLGDTLGEGGVTTDYCYRSDKLVRAKLKLIDLGSEVSYTRVAYYDDNGAPMADSGIAAAPIMAGGAAPPIPSASALAIPSYRTAQHEPFYAALQAAIKVG